MAEGEETGYVGVENCVAGNGTWNSIGSNRVERGRGVK